LQAKAKSEREAQLQSNLQAKAKSEREAQLQSKLQAKAKSEREAQLQSKLLKLLKLQSQVVDLLPYKAKYELLQEKQKKKRENTFSSPI
jgi:hypothetical protein